VTLVNLPHLRPMLAVSSEPFDSSDYLFEIKWDGYRCLIYLEDNTTILRSRNGFDLSGQFPELAGLHKEVKQQPAILDGEIVVLKNGKPSFSRIQSRGRLKDPIRIGRARAEDPAIFIPFDILYCAGKNIMELTLKTRKERLEESVVNGEAIVTSQYILNEGLKFFAACVEQGLEGVVAKKIDSIYLPGRRSSSWLKFRHTREADLVICGYQPGVSGRRLGSLVLGGYKDGRLVYQGKVGTGFSEQEYEALLDGLRKLEVVQEPLLVPREEKRRTIFVRPSLVCSVEYLTTTGEGYLRHPVYRGIRWDKPPEECQFVEN